MAGLLSIFAFAAQATIINVVISGTFGLPLTPTFPFPNLVGGSFAGSFTYDDAALPFLSTGSSDSFDVLSNTVELRSPASNLEYTITIDGNNELRLISVPGVERLIIFLGDSTTTFPDDLRLAFDIGSLGIVPDGSPLTVAEFATAIRSGSFVQNESILDIEGIPDDFTLAVASVVAAVPPAVSEPTTLALMILGISGLLLVVSGPRVVAQA